jgi:RNA polymerase primary sigma factor
MLNTAAETLKISTENIINDSADTEDQVLLSDDFLQDYLQQATKTPLFTVEEEQKYGRLLKYGTPKEKAEAKELFVLKNMRLVISIAKKFRTNSSRSLEDNIQDGVIGLMRAIDSYDIDLGYRFTTYATWWIKQSIMRSIANTANAIRFPAHVVDAEIRYRKYMAVQQQNGRIPTDQELIKALKITRETLKFIQSDMQNMQNEVSLDTPVNRGNGEQDTVLGDFVEDKNAEAVESGIIQKEKEAAIQQWLTILTSRERDVIMMRFGFSDKNGKCYTLAEIGEKYDISRERIRQIENKALNKLKRSKLASKMRDFAEE